MLACGQGAIGDDKNHNKCEIYKINDTKWESIASYPSVLVSES